MPDQTQTTPDTIGHNPPPKMTQFQNPKHREEAGGYGHQLRRRRRSLCCGSLVAFLVLAAVTALVLWLVYRPHKPKFRVVSAAVYELNLTGPALISTSMQFTLVTRNPNRRVSFHYDHLSAFVSHRNQPITPPVSLPPLFHETKSTVAMSPVLGGAAVAVADEVGGNLAEDEGYGVVGLRVVVTGKVRYRVAGGVTIRRRRSVYVRCDLLVGLKDGFGGKVPLLQSPPCTVHL